MGALEIIFIIIIIIIIIARNVLWCQGQSSHIHANVCILRVFVVETDRNMKTKTMA